MLQRITEIMRMVLYVTVVAVGRCLNRHRHAKTFLIYTAPPKRILAELEGKQSFGYLLSLFRPQFEEFQVKLGDMHRRQNVGHICFGVGRRVLLCLLCGL